MPEQFQSSIAPIVKLIKISLLIGITSSAQITSDLMNEFTARGENYAKSIVSYIFTNKILSKWKTSCFCHAMK